MVAYDPRRPSDGKKRLSQATSTSLLDALRAQRTAGRTPEPALQSAIGAVAAEARELAMEPEQLLVQLKQLFAEAGLTPQLGDENANALREWMVSACIQAYYRASS